MSENEHTFEMYKIRLSEAKSHCNQVKLLALAEKQMTYYLINASTIRNASPQAEARGLDQGGSGGDL